MGQLAFSFVGEIDRELAEKAEADRRDMQQRNWDAILKWHVEEYPPEKEEWDIMLMGIRLSRHVHDSECQRCKLGCFNHCPDALGMIKVCLKDYFRWCVQHGLKDWVKEALA